MRAGSCSSGRVAEEVEVEVEVEGGRSIRVVAWVRPRGPVGVWRVGW